MTTFSDWLEPLRFIALRVLRLPTDSAIWLRVRPCTTVVVLVSSDAPAWGEVALSIIPKIKIIAAILA